MDGRTDGRTENIYSIFRDKLLLLGEHVFGSGVNFYGGPGESAHKQFIKIPAQRTQRRVSEFAQQTAFQYYNMLVSSNAAHDFQIRSNLHKQSGNTATDFACTETKGEVVIEMSRKYDFTVTRKVIEMIEAESKIIVNWSSIIKS
jgi:hypothetical protein